MRLVTVSVRLINLHLHLHSHLQTAGCIRLSLHKCVPLHMASAITNTNRSTLVCKWNELCLPWLQPLSHPPAATISLIILQYPLACWNTHVYSSQERITKQRDRQTDKQTHIWLTNQRLHEHHSQIVMYLLSHSTTYWPQYICFPL